MRTSAVMLATLFLTFRFLTIEPAHAQKPKVEAATTEVEYEGTIDREEVRKAIQSQMKDILSCYDNELKKHPNLAGKVVMSFDVNEKGEARASKVKESTLSNEKVHKCLQVQIEGLKFPKTRVGTMANIVFPFVFSNK